MATEITKIAYGGNLMLFVTAASLPVAFSTAAKLEVKLATRQISSKDSGNWVEKQAGRLDWSASTDALYTEVLTGTATTTSYDELYALMIARAPISMVFAQTNYDKALTPDVTPDWTPNTTTKKNYTGQVIITGLSVNAPDGETATYSVSLEGTGALVQA